MLTIEAVRDGCFKAGVRTHHDHMGTMVRVIHLISALQTAEDRAYTDDKVAVEDLRCKDRLLVEKVSPARRDGRDYRPHLVRPLLQEEERALVQNARYAERNDDDYDYELAAAIHASLVKLTGPQKPWMRVNAANVAKQRAVQVRPGVFSSDRRSASVPRRPSAASAPVLQRGKTMWGIAKQRQFTNKDYAKVPAIAWRAMVDEGVVRPSKPAFRDFCTVVLHKVRDRRGWRRGRVECMF